MRAIEIKTVAALPQKFDGSITRVRLKRNTLPPRIRKSRITMIRNAQTGKLASIPDFRDKIRANETKAIVNLSAIGSNTLPSSDL